MVRSQSEEWCGEKQKFLISSVRKNYARMYTQKLWFKHKKNLKLFNIPPCDVSIFFSRFSSQIQMFTWVNFCSYTMRVSRKNGKRKKITTGKIGWGHYDGVKFQANCC